MLKGAVRSRSQLPLFLLVYCSTPTIDGEPKKPKESSIYYPTKGKVGKDGDPSNRKRKLWGNIWFTLAIPFLFFAIISSGKVRQPKIDPKSSLSPTEAVPSPTPSITPTNTPTFDYDSAYQATLPSKKSIPLSEINPILEMANNFFTNGWSDKSPFMIDDGSYDEGLGMQLCERKTGDEKCVPSRDGNYRKDCREVYIDYPLRQKYEFFTFLYGVDRSDSTRFGNDAVNGIAKLVISDVDTNKILYFTEWFDYKYAATEFITLDVSKVKVLRITYCSSGIPGPAIRKGLRIALVEPKLILKDDPE